MYLKGEIILLPFILQAKILAKDIERAGAKYYESKVLGTDKKNRERPASLADIACCAIFAKKTQFKSKSSTQAGSACGGQRATHKGCFTVLLSLCC